MTGPGLNGRIIATLESRRAEEMASLIARHGGVPYSAPALKEVPLDNGPEISAFLDRLMAAPAPLVVFLTGVGTRALLETASREGRLEQVYEALVGATVVVRGPKPTAVLRQHKVRIDAAAPEPNTTTELLEVLDRFPLRGRTVAVQHYGEPNLPFTEALAARGAQLLEVSLYRYAQPEDQGPLLRFLDAARRGEVDAVLATSQSQVHNLFTLAEAHGQAEGLRDALNGRLVVASVGPVTARAWEDWGVRVDVMPEHPHMGHLVLALVEHFQGAAVR